MQGVQKSFNLLLKLLRISSKTFPCLRTKSLTQLTTLSITSDAQPDARNYHPPKSDTSTLNDKDQVSSYFERLIEAKGCLIEVNVSAELLPMTEPHEIALLMPELNQPH